jgi:hypothetical protein
MVGRLLHLPFWALLERQPSLTLTLVDRNHELLEQIVWRAQT